MTPTPAVLAAVPAVVLAVAIRAMRGRAAFVAAVVAAVPPALIRAFHGLPVCAGTAPGRQWSAAAMPTPRGVMPPAPGLPGHAIWPRVMA
ncbi:hypothetical protein GE300_20490 [Rhodobacteraceae bacterium 2CG4]|uniref:Uncharacterized protein n=1 Tax=Halovulum marinum TaxID=2662447 RepID=A0A6L5Z6F5_9RHOB|nr:hypothetical protein [Halovulum marinum]MSU91939.1 hypothetical protein [Halovulum marinum]